MVSRVFISEFKIPIGLSRGARHLIVPLTLLGSEIHSFIDRSRSALAMTETELKLIAAPAIIGLRRIPKNGYKAPAAIGTPSAL